ncbi:MAG TPA: flagellar filament capping protein FliD [Lachnospiraceae bacterium]|nr:flagellar filament capping protein FliD [Lachnospiraceae bacterium]
MAMRMTGLMSGMDTESIIKELVAVKQMKVDDTKKAQTKLEWKQNSWNALNTKLKNLQSKYLNSMRFSTAYSKKATSVSNSSAVNVLTGEDAVNGVQALEIKKLAKTSYLTGAKIGTDTTKYTALSKLSDLSDSITGEGTLNLTVGDSITQIKVSGDSTISDVLTQIKNAGLNANFDANNQRFFISAKESGALSDFSLTVSDANGSAALAAMGLSVNLNSDATALKEYQKYDGYYVSGDRSATLANMQTMIDSVIEARKNGYLDQYKNLKSSMASVQSKIDVINEKYKDSTLKTVSEYTTDIEAKNEEISNLQTSMESMSESDKAAAQAQLDVMKTELTDLTQKKADATTLETQQSALESLNNRLTNVLSYVDVTESTVDDKTTYTTTATAKLTGEVEDMFYDKAAYADQVMAGYDPTDVTQTGATKIAGQDAVIYLNGAEFTDNDNVFKINGLTFTALAETASGESITITTQNDTDGIYDMIKNFFKEYNSIINEMDKLYNAEFTKVEPLTEDEKDAMSDSEVDRWEQKVKDSLLRRDSNLSTISSAMKDILLSGVEVNGITMYLSNFGINTLGYFNAADNEKNAYHIDGDEDDSNTAGNADKLKGLISSDPDTVVSFFSSLSNMMYSKMSSLSASVEGYRSYGNFFDDKKMKSDYTDYASRIEDQEEKLTDFEDKWYAKFSAMETALARMQSNSNAVTSLLGGQ